MSREEILFDAITNIREDLVEEAQGYDFRKKQNSWRRYGTLAACLALASALCLGAYQLSRGSKVCSDWNGAAPPSVSSNQFAADTGDTPNDSPPIPEACPPSADGIPWDGDSEDAALGDSPLVFTATVLEVHETYLLVSQKEEPVRVPIDGLANLPEFQEGDVVQILCETFSAPDGVKTASGVTEIQLAEPQPDGP